MARDNVPPIDQPTEDSPAVRLDEPQVVDVTAVEEAVPFSPPQPPPAYDAGGSSGAGTSPREADQRGAEHGPGGRPELEALGAFVGAFALAKILKALGGGD